MMIWLKNTKKFIDKATTKKTTIIQNNKELDKQHHQETNQLKELIKPITFKK